MTKGYDLNGNPVDYEEWQDEQQKKGCLNGVTAILLGILTIIALAYYCSGQPVPHLPFEALVGPTLTPTAASQPMSYSPPTVTVGPPTIAAVPACVQGPPLIDPIGNKPIQTTTLVLEWQGGEALKPGEFYDVLASPNAFDLMGAKPNLAASLGRTTEKKLNFDLQNWKNVPPLVATLVGPTPVGPTPVGPTKVGPTKVGPTKAGPTSVGPTQVGPTKAGPTQVGPTKAGPTQVGPTKVPTATMVPGATKIFWVVRILGSDGTYRDCQSEPSAFVLLPSGPPSAGIVMLPSNPPPPAVACVAPPVLFDPPDGKTFWARNTVLRWRSDYELKADEVYAAYVWPEGHQDKTRIASLRDKTAPIDLMQWEYKGWVSRFYWDVRIERTDGTVVSCEHPPLAFGITAPPEAEPQQGQPQQPGKPQGPIGVPVFPCGGPSCQ